MALSFVREAIFHNTLVRLLCDWCYIDFESEMYCTVGWERDQVLQCRQLLLLHEIIMHAYYKLLQLVMITFKTIHHILHRRDVICTY